MENASLAKIANNIRKGIIQSTYCAKSGHPGGSLSCAELMAYLYFELLRIDPEHPRNPDRDRLVLSKGHAAPALYSALAEKGYFDKSELLRLRHIGSMLQGHPDMKRVPGVDMSTGSLGQGFSAAVGMAVAGKLDKRDYYVYAICGDGEIEEGQIWEAAMFAGNHKLDNLIVFIDNNNLQIDGTLSEVCSPYPIDKKFEAFNFNVITIDGHDYDQLRESVQFAHSSAGKPSAVIMKTIKGKGVSFMENAVGWHGKATNDEEFRLAMEELENNEKEGGC